MSQPPYRFEGSSFGCTAYGGYCFDCKVPIGDESFKYGTFTDHWHRKLKINKHHTIGAVSTKKEFVKIIKQKIKTLQGVKNNYVTDEQKQHYCCSVCSKYCKTLGHAKKHQTDGKCKEGTFSKKYLLKTTCGRFVEPPQNYFEQNIPQDQAEIESSQEELTQKMIAEILKLKESHHSKVEALNASVTELTATVTELKQLIGQQTASFTVCTTALNTNLAEKERLNKELKVEIEVLKSKNIELMEKLIEKSEICQCSKSNTNSTLNNKKRKQDEFVTF